MQGFVDNDESLKEKIRFFVNKKDICNGYSCYDESYALPKLVKNIFRQKICSIDFDDASLTNDGKVLQIIASKMKGLAFFVGMLKFKDTNPNGIANKVLNEIRAAFQNELEKKQNAKLNFEGAQ